MTVIVIQLGLITETPPSYWCVGVEKPQTGVKVHLWAHPLEIPLPRQLVHTSSREGSKKTWSLPSGIQSPLISVDIIKTLV